MATKKQPYELTNGTLQNIAGSYPGGIAVQAPTLPKTAQQQANDLLGQINNRAGFQYDPSTDPLWQNIRNEYIHNGQRAMQDTMGQAAGLTGGYGSTYAQGVGQQAYNEYLLGLNGQMSAAYDRSRAAYDADTADLYNRYNLAMGAAQDEYNRNRDAMLDDRYSQEYADQMAYQQWQQQQAERNYADDQEYREWQMRQAELDRQDSLNKQNQSMAYEMVMNMISTGQVPPAELLAAAGVSADYARSMAGYYGQQAALAASSGGSGSNGSSPSPRRTADRTQNDDVTDPPAQTAMNPAQLSAYGAMAGIAGAASVPQNMITSAQRDELFAYGQKNGPQALAAYMDANYKGASNYWEIRKWLQSQLTKAQNSGAGGSGKPNVNMTR